jgi:hypothetical protein
MQQKPVEKHRGHPKRIVLGPFGPHAAKMECMVCKCFVKWVSKEMLKSGKITPLQPLTYVVE